MLLAPRIRSVALPRPHTVLLQLKLVSFSRVKNYLRFNVFGAHLISDCSISSLNRK